MQMFFLLLLFVSFLGYMFWAQARTSLQFEIMPVLVICGHVLVLYVASLLKLLYVSSILLFITGLALFIYFIIDLKNMLRVRIREAAAFFYSFSCVFFLSWFFARGKIFASWDELTHWGLVFKMMLLSNALPTTSSSVFALSYPVGTSLYQFYVAKVLQAFQTSTSFPLADEGLAYFANYLFLGMPLFVLASHYRNRNIFYYLPLLFGAFFLNFLGLPNGQRAGFTLYSLYPDGQLGILFGAGLVLLLSSSRENTVRNMIPVSVLASTLVLVKQVGIVFSVILMIPVAISIIREFMLLKKEGLDSPSKTIDNPRFRNWAACLLLVFIPVLLYLSWSLHVRHLNTSFTGELNSNFSEEMDKKRQLISSLVSSNGNFDLSFVRQLVPAHERMIVKQFGKAMLQRPIGFTGSPTLRLVILFLILTFISYLWTPDNRRQLLTLNMLVIAGFIGYSLFLLFLYLYLFGEEFLPIPGFERYISSYLLGWGMFIFYGLLQPVAGMEAGLWERKAVLSLLLTTWILGIVIVRIPNGYINTTVAVPSERVLARSLTERFGPQMELDSRVYHIVQGYEGILYHFMVRLELAPRYTQFDTWSLGGNSSNYRPDEWFALLKEQKYDYVLISHADPKFWSTYRELFVGQSEEDVPQLFKVGDTKLVRIK